MNQPVPIRPAATVVLVRDSARGIEVFMMRRSQNAAFMGGAHVFPGGAVDTSDSADQWAGLCAGIDMAAANRILGVEQDGLAYWIAAIRECFEEAGILLANDKGGDLIAIDDAKSVADFSALRQQMADGKLSLHDLCELRHLTIAADRMAYFSHWITPPHNVRRFDTRFFVAVAPALQTPSHDDTETVAHVWVGVNEALDKYRRKELEMVFPTVRTLETLASFPDTAALMAHARAERIVPRILPRASSGRDGRRMLVPTDYAYAEIAKLDPDGKGFASYEIIPGVLTRLSARVHRLTAPNPGFMTGPGTNAYLVGEGEDFAVIDPGPPDESHVQAIIDAVNALGPNGQGGKIRKVLVTHTHKDHSPAARLLKAHTGAELIGMPPPPGDGQDQTFQPDHVARDGDRIAIAGAMLRVVHTPGHASNQVCYLLEEEKLLFTGDHIMQGSTVVINPPDGDMAVYLAALKKLLKEQIDWLAPGHGFIIDRPHEAVERLVAHRLGRENKVLEKLQGLGAATLDELVPHAYDEVPKQLHRVATRSLLAHLLKLQGDGRAGETEGRWRAL